MGQGEPESIVKLTFLEMMCIHCIVNCYYFYIDLVYCSFFICPFKLRPVHHGSNKIIFLNKREKKVQAQQLIIEDPPDID